jgi:DNA-binding transcriptional LysR family regulator
LSANFKIMKSDAEQLRLLGLVGEHGSLAAAADILGLTAAAVTQRLARTEDTWGLPLVLRGPRGATLTPAGRILAEHGHRIQTETVRAQEAFAAFQGAVARRLRIGAFQAAALHLLPPALTALRHRQADSDISVVDIESIHGPRMVADGDLDLAVIAAWDTPPQPPPGVELVPLMKDPMVLVLPDDHPLVGRRRRLRLEELRDEAWVVIRAGTAARLQFDRATRAAGFTAKIRFETESYDVAQALVGTGYGVAMVSRLARNAVPGTAHVLVTGVAELNRRLYAALPTERGAAPLVDEFLTLLADVATDLSQRASAK